MSTIQSVSGGSDGPPLPDNGNCSFTTLISAALFLYEAINDLIKVSSDNGSSIAENNQMYTEFQANVMNHAQTGDPWLDYYNDKTPSILKKAVDDAKAITDPNKKKQAIDALIQNGTLVADGFYDLPDDNSPVPGYHIACPGIANIPAPSNDQPAAGRISEWQQQATTHNQIVQYITQGPITATNTNAQTVENATEASSRSTQMIFSIIAAIIGVITNIAHMSFPTV